MRGVRVHRQIGKGREFERLRDYLPGDSYEDIHWKATARRRTPAVKLYQARACPGSVRGDRCVPAIGAR